MREHPSLSVVEKDTVYNDGTNGPFILVSFGLLIGVLHFVKNAKTMAKGVRYVKTLLGDDLFQSIFPVLLTDQESEFLIRLPLRTG